MEITQEFYDTVKKSVMKQIKGCTLERVEDAVQTAFEAYLKKEAKGEVIHEPIAFLVLVAKRKYYQVLTKESRSGVSIPFNRATSENIEESFYGEQCRDILVALSQGHSIREVAEAYGLTYYKVREIKENWINS